MAQSPPRVGDDVRRRLEREEEYWHLPLEKVISSTPLTGEAVFCYLYAQINPLRRSGLNYYQTRRARTRSRTSVWSSRTALLC